MADEKNIFCNIRRSIIFKIIMSAKLDTKWPKVQHYAGNLEVGPPVQMDIGIGSYYRTSPQNRTNIPLIS